MAKFVRIRKFFDFICKMYANNFVEIGTPTRNNNRHNKPLALSAKYYIACICLQVLVQSCVDFWRQAIQTLVFLYSLYSLCVRMCECVCCWFEINLINVCIQCLYMFTFITLDFAIVEFSHNFCTYFRNGVCILL